VAFSDPKNERALSHLLVLLQYNWPQEEEMFASVITTIQKRRKFNFPEFFSYVISILYVPCTLVHTGSSLKWSGNDDGSKLEVEILFFIKKQAETT